MRPPLLASRHIQAVSFDLDGTLYDFRRHQVNLLPSVLRHPKVVLGFREVVRSLRGESFDDLPGEIDRRLALRVGASPERVRRVLNKTVYGAWPSSFKPAMALDGMHRLLATLDRLGVPRVLVSDHPAQDKLRGLGMSDGWAAVLDAESLGAFKPDPAPFIEAAKRLGLQPDQLVHVGDRDDTDEPMARSVGAPCLIRGRDWDHTEQLGRLLLSRAWADDTPTSGSDNA